MRIGLLTEFPLCRVPGWPESLRRMRRALTGAGHEVDLLHEAPRPARSVAWLRRMKILPEEAVPTAARLARDAKEADRRAAATDVILAVMGSDLLARMRAPQPVVHCSDATWRLLRAEYAEHKAADARHEAIELAVMRRADAHVYSSEWARASAIADYGVPAARTSVVPLGANFAARKPPTPLAPLVEGGRCELLFVSRNWQRKRGDLALEILAELRRRGRVARLTVIGEMPPQAPQQPAEALRMLGWLEPHRSADAAKYRVAMQEAHLLLLPTGADCTPIVCAEASSFAVPVLASDVGGVSAMVQDGVNGALLDRGANARAYADRIEAWWSDPAGYLALRRGARTHYEQRLTWSAWARDVGEVLSAVTSARSGRGAA